MDEKSEEGYGTQLARIEEKMESVLLMLKCLPDLCETQARHDERISILESGGRWMLGIVATVLSGLALAFAALVKDLYSHFMIGGKP